MGEGRTESSGLLERETVLESGEGEVEIRVTPPPPAGVWCRHFDDGVLFTSVVTPRRGPGLGADLKLPYRPQWAARALETHQGGHQGGR